MKFKPGIVAEVQVLMLLHVCQAEREAAVRALFLLFRQVLVIGLPFPDAVLFPGLAVGLQGIDKAGLLLDADRGQVQGS